MSWDPQWSWVRVWVEIHSEADSGGELRSTLKSSPGVSWDPQWSLVREWVEIHSEVESWSELRSTVKFSSGVSWDPQWSWVREWVEIHSEVESGSELRSTVKSSPGVSWDPQWSLVQEWVEMGGTLRQIGQCWALGVCQAGFVHNPFYDVFHSIVLLWLQNKTLRFRIKTFHIPRFVPWFWRRISW